MSDIEKVKQLREATGAGFKDCNLAVKESGGDLDKAVEILRVKGISKASKKMSRDAKEGVIATSGDENKISVLELNCETDFVAKNEDFVSYETAVWKPIAQQQILDGYIKYLGLSELIGSNDVTKALESTATHVVFNFPTKKKIQQD